VSRQNVEVARGFTEAFNAHDVEGIIATCAPDVELHSTFAAVGGAVYHGHDGVRSWYRDIEQTWGREIRSQPESLFDLGDDVLTFTLLEGQGTHSGVQVALPAAIVTRVRAGLIVRFRGYAHREDALGDLGVSEDSLKPIVP
jgi:ketosteroid isomerase-like protein